MHDGNKLHLVFDIETLSTEGNAVILSFSCIPYHLEKSKDKTMVEIINEGFDIKLDTREQIKKGRHISKPTMDWWKTQSKEAQSVLAPREDDATAAEFAKRFSNWTNKIGYDPSSGLAWQRGSIDIIWLDSYYKDMLGIDNVNDKPIRWYRVNDIRTAINVSGTSKNLNGYPDGSFRAMALHFPEFVAHNSLHDCAKQILEMKIAGIF